MADGGTHTHDGGEHRGYKHEHEHGHGHGHSHGGLDAIHTVTDVSPVHEAAREGDLAELRKIIAEDPSKAQELDKYGLTPLHWACDRGHLSIVRFLIEEVQVDVNAVEKRLFRRQPIHFAGLNGPPEVMQFIVSHGADLEARDYRGWNALHCAAHGGFGDVCSVLVESGAELKSMSLRKETALHLAARCGHDHVLRVLLQNVKPAAAFVQQRDQDGDSALDVAQACGHTTCATVLRQCIGAASPSPSA
ncbi:TPA: hypothetical protein N0F65_010780 [Lagenidium giganteum]|uniref:Uncharacterized protein n=1 Tax=Lagenidium giganteum TaxID=4803 RepID=A0AAV2YUJ1_9STRA|nr:TPA: hypothetical protein N0F65_010780 [Lagenidium giganteum]